jgi:hypothetical protein
MIDWLIYSGLAFIIPKGYADNKEINDKQASKNKSPTKEILRPSR